MPLKVQAMRHDAKTNDQLRNEIAYYEMILRQSKSPDRLQRAALAITARAKVLRSRGV